MSRWSALLLGASMLVWTALTLAAGWYALIGWGGASSASAQDIALVYDVAAPDSPRQVHRLTTAQAKQAFPEASPTAATGFQNAGALQAPPRYAARADGIGVQTKAADTTAPKLRTAPAPGAAPVRKGVIVLDPGHGRGDPGAVHYLPDGSGRWDLTEADLNLRNAELLRDELVRMGYDVYLTRTGDGEGPAGPLPRSFILSDLFSRVALSQSVNADLYLALHGNGATVKSISGPEVWYCGKKADGAENERLARMVQRAMMDALHEYGYFPPDRGIKEDAASRERDVCPLVVTRETTAPAVLLEFLFLTNDDDARVLADDRSHVLMARRVAQALDEFMRTR